MAYSTMRPFGTGILPLHRVILYLTYNDQPSGVYWSQVSAIMEHWDLLGRQAGTTCAGQRRSYPERFLSSADRMLAIRCFDLLELRWIR